MFYYIYIVECCDGTFYTGLAKDLSKRIDEHNFSDKGAKYTKARRPVVLRYSEKLIDRSSACKREYEIKQLRREEKVRLIDENSSS